jgi:redox-sensitive bicupin YhaK (pirin superfamily)
MKILKSQATLEGAGVRLKRAFGYYEVPLLDPFLLLDDFHSSNPDDYLAGFPWHPHRGIETVTYMLDGKVKHEDSIGNSGVINGGDLQWMTAGSGIIHSEMPHQQNGLLWGFQLWVNLPSSSKMMMSRYREIKNEEIPEVILDQKVKMRIICGTVNGIDGPVRDITVDAEYLDVTVPSGTDFSHRVKKGYLAFAYVIEGEGWFGNRTDEPVEPEHLVIFRNSEKVEMATKDNHIRFLLISGKPIGEPVAWRGPIVMNTQEELDTAFEEYRNGTFIKHDK